MGEFVSMTAKQYREILEGYDKKLTKNFKEIAKKDKKLTKDVKKSHLDVENSKFFAKKTEIDGIMFDSVKEGKRYEELKFLEKQGKVSGVVRQKAFILQPGFIDNEGHSQRPIKYLSDFFYYDTETKQWVVEDVKSSYTRRLPVYKIKKKMFLLHYPQYKFTEMV